MWLHNLAAYLKVEDIKLDLYREHVLCHKWSFLLWVNIAEFYILENNNWTQCFHRLHENMISFTDYGRLADLSTDCCPVHSVF